MFHLQSRNVEPVNIPWLLGKFIPGLAYVVNNHGFFVSPPKDRVMGPLPNGLIKWLIYGCDPNHLLTGMILQVVVFTPFPDSMAPKIHVDPVKIARSRCHFGFKVRQQRRVGPSFWWSQRVTIETCQGQEAQIFPEKKWDTEMLNVHTLALNDISKGTFVRNL